MKRFFILLIAVIINLNSYAKSEVDSLLVSLQNHMNRRIEYDAEKNLRIREIKDLKKGENTKKEQLFFIHSQLIEEYAKFIFDSALYYCELNIRISQELKDDYMQITTQIKLAEIMAKSGRYKEAGDILQSIHRKSISHDLLPEYYKAYIKLYSNLSFYAKINVSKTAYQEKNKRYSDSLLAILNENSEDYLMVLETRLRDSRDMEACMEINTQRMSMVNMGSEHYSVITFERAINYRVMENIQEMEKYFILSAISDIKNSVKDNASLAALAEVLFQEGKLELAHEFISFSYEDAVYFNSRLRFSEISSILPIIESTYRLKIDKKQKALLLSFILISVLFIGLIFAVLLLHKQMKNLAKTQEKLKISNNKLRSLNIDLQNSNKNLEILHLDLSEANRLKEHYIGNFFSICSDYVNKLDDYRKMVNKHISNREIQELFNKTKTKDFIEEEKQNFYKNFDITFLGIFPNFAEQINSLIVDDAQIGLKNDELLNTELRIFALIRLGISDSNQIASLLDYSIRTIYNYRVKFKNKMKNPADNFEDQIIKIGAFSA